MTGGKPMNTRVKKNLYLLLILVLLITHIYIRNLNVSLGFFIVLFICELAINKEEYSKLTIKNSKKELMALVVTMIVLVLVERWVFQYMRLDSIWMGLSMPFNMLIATNISYRIKDR